jgi:nucleotide-binding universal stress UspA family protein
VTPNLQDFVRSGFDSNRWHLSSLTVELSLVEGGVMETNSTTSSKAAGVLHSLGHGGHSPEEGRSAPPARASNLPSYELRVQAPESHTASLIEQILIGRKDLGVVESGRGAVMLSEIHSVMESSPRSSSAVVANSLQSVHSAGEGSEFLSADRYVAIKNVAVATDFSVYSERAVQHALAVAHRFGATLHLLHVVRPSQFAFAPDALASIGDAAERDCKELSTRIQNSHQLEGLHCRRWVERGEIYEVVGRFVKSQRIDLLVTGTHGRSGIQRLVLGSVAHQIFHCVRCPLLTVGPQAPGAGVNPQLRHILFATDLSRGSLAAIPYVITAARAWHTSLDVLHVCTTAHLGHAERLNDFRKRIDELYGGSEHESIKCTLAIGDPAQSVLDFSARNEVDLIVLGLETHRSLYSSPFWSDAYAIVRRATCPVLSVRSSEG